MKPTVAILPAVGVLVITQVNSASAKPILAFSPLFLPFLLLYAVAPSLALALVSRLVMEYSFSVQGNFWLIFLLTLLGWFFSYLLPFSTSSWGMQAGAY
jgi:Na+/serine symporter